MSALPTYIFIFLCVLTALFFLLNIYALRQHRKVIREIDEIDDLIAAISRENAAIKREIAAIDEDRFTGGKV